MAIGPESITSIIRADGSAGEGLPIFLASVQRLAQAENRSEHFLLLWGSGKYYDSQMILWQTYWYNRITKLYLLTI